MKIDLRCYFVVDGVPSMRDSRIVQLYERMAADGTLAQINYEGRIPSGAALVQAAKAAIYFAVVCADGEEVAIVWLNRWQPRRAHLHFCMFSNGWGKNSQAIGRAVLAHLFTITTNGTPCLDMIWGIAPATNERACAYVQSCGGQLSGLIPNYVWNAAAGCSEAGYLFHITREQTEAAGYAG